MEMYINATYIIRQDLVMVLRREMKEFKEGDVKVAIHVHREVI
jgi:hypothetical protein